MSRIEDLEGRLAKDPNSKIFGQLAEEYRKVGRLEDAIRICREGLENHPNYFSARVALGRALLESNELEEAGRELEAVLSQVPDNILANKFLGQTYEQLGRLDDAVAKYRIAQMLAPEDAELAGVVQKLEAQLDGVSTVSGGPPSPAPPVVDDPTAIEIPEVPETEAVPLAPHDSAVEPTLLEEEPPGFDREPLLEPTLREEPKPSGEGEGPAQEQVFELEREQVFEFDDTPPGEPEPPSPSVGRQVSEFNDSHVSDEARAIQDEIEQRFPTGVMKRQMSEIMDSTGSPGPSETDTREAFETPLPPVAAEPEPPVVEPTPPELIERGTTQPMDFEPQPSLEEPASVRPTPAPPGLPESKDSPGMSTATLAELYASQGHLEQALGVYREILGTQPDDKQIRQRVEELTMLVHAQTESGAGGASRGPIQPGPDRQPVSETIRILEGWLAAIRRP